MTPLTFCPRCKGAIFHLPHDPAHTCAPAWRCWDADDEEREDAHTVHAHDPEEAARKYAHDLDNQSDGDVVLVAVVAAGAPDHEAPSLYRTRAELVMHYHTRQLDLEDDLPEHETHRVCRGCRARRARGLPIDHPETQLEADHA